MGNFTYVNRRFLHVFVLLMLSLSGQAQQIAKSLTASNGTFIGFLEYKPTDYNPSSTKKYPLIIFLHGIGERGNGTTEISRVTAQGIPKNIAKGHKMTFTFNGKTETFLVLSPQLDAKYGSWQQFYTDEMLKYAKANLNIDTNRIILTGLSLGGGGTWNYASASEAKAKQFAAIAPICGTCSMTNGCNIAKANLPVWTEHAQNDPTVSVNCTINANKAINACNPGIAPIQFLPPTGGHSIWTRSFDTTYTYHQPNIYEWFLGQNKSLAPNKLPVAVATAPAEVAITKASIILNGSSSTDADGSIVRYVWRQISGPVATVISSKGSANTDVSGLTALGSYSYELTVVDNRANWSIDTVIINGVNAPVVTPNKAPAANAGADKTITLPANSVSLDGSLSSDSDGSINTYSWTKISGPSSGSFSAASSVNTNFNSLIEGTYQVQLKVTDNGGAIGLDTVQIIVKPAPNKAPTANAGADQTITLPLNSVVLSAAASTDSDGTITAYAWTKISGPAAGTFSAANSSATSFSSLIEGTYSIQLKVTDNNGASHSDTVIITVKPEPIIVVPNKVPVANAGNYQSITLPLNSVSLDASLSNDPDGSIVSYEWTKISGPASGTISNANSVKTSFSSLIEGTYTVQLEVKDNDGAGSLDTVQIIVKPAPNKAPIANAGADQTITLPLNSVNLSAAASTDSDGTITAYAWTKISGPAAGTFSAANSSGTSFSSLIEGTYSIQLKVTDNNGESHLDTVTITVKPEPIIVVPNKVPVANAGNDQSITLPLNSVPLDASLSNDPDGSIVSYAWTKISGPASGTFSNANSAKTSLSSLIEGTYTVQLEVKDNDGAVSMDTVMIVVKPAPNKAPVANAGSDKTITLPTNSVTLSATGSSDPDGTITSYSWIKISGPASGTLTNQNASSTTFGTLSEGTYSVQLKVTDNIGASDLDTVTIIVKPEPVIIIPNKAPTANAGADQVITLPSNSVNLNASSSSDTDGTITTYQWNKISGPTQGTLSNANSVTTGFNSLIEGTYLVQLKVTDNDGASSSDTMKIVVNPVPNKAPIANAGKDQQVLTTASKVELDGTLSADPDGTISSYSWNRVSGAGTMTLTQQDQTVAIVYGLAEGTHVFRLTVKDNKGATASDEVTVQVKQPINQKPIADAGDDTSIYYPLNKTALVGTRSKDNDGKIIKYSWKQIIGTSVSRISSPDQAQTEVSEMAPGAFQFELSVTDDKGETAKDTVNVMVINNLKYEERIQTHPNPAVNSVKIKIQSDSNGSCQLTIRDCFGRVLKQLNSEKNSNIHIETVDITSFKKGLYCVEYSIEKSKRMVTRFIKH